MISPDPLRDLADRHAIIDLIHRYCRSVDRLDVPLGHSIWHDDGIADYGAVYQGNGRGVIDFICAQMTIWSRYIDRWSRRAGRWGLDKRIAIRDFDEIREVVPLGDHDAGRRDRSDPSYAVLKDPKGGGS